MKPLKRLQRYVSALSSLGRQAERARKHSDQVNYRLETLERDLGTACTDLARLWENFDRLEHMLQDRTNELLEEARDVSFNAKAEQKTVRRLVETETAALARTLSDLTRRMDDLLLNRDRLELPEQAAETPPAGAAGMPASDGFEAFKDSFYHRLENRYRGAEEEIAARLRIYLPDVEAAFLRTGDLPVMDIGCGRGEWLGLLQDVGIKAFGVDTNPLQIDDARRRGLDVRLGDAIAFLAGAEDASLSVITAHHLIEHLPFDVVAWITREAMRVLAPGGLLLFETPNTRNVLVGATTFHTDPTHLKPMPEQVMGVLLDTAGFDPVEIRHLNPHERFQEFLAKPDFNNELASLMFGPQDLAILGTRPSGD